MSMPLPPEEFLTEYKGKWNFELRVKHLKIGLLLAITLVPFFSILDWIVYSDYFGVISAWRYSLELVLLLMLYSLYTSFSKYVWLTGVICILVLNATFCVMIFLTDGMSSPYYAGMNLAILMALVLLPYTALEALLVCVGSIAMYVTACLLHGGSHNWVIFSNNMFFLLGTSLICVCGSYILEKRRLNTFLLTYELDKTNKRQASLSQDLWVKNSELTHALSQLRQAQEELIHSEKINSLGTMAAGLLHEINNPVNFGVDPFPRTVRGS
jgi:two-component system, sensor histidine kinase PhcS